jgi:hypothetical protein
MEKNDKGNKMSIKILKTELFGTISFKYILISLVLSVITFFDLGNVIFLKSIVAFNFLFIVPGLSIYLSLEKRNSLEDILHSIVLSFAYWTVVAYVFIKTQMMISLLSVGLFAYLFIISMLIVYIFRSFKNIEQESSSIDKKINEDANQFQESIHNANEDLNQTQKSNDSTKSLKIKTFLNSNPLFLIVFLILLAIFACTRIPYVPADDVWYHMAVTQDIKDYGYIFNPDEHRGNLSYHFIGCIFSIFSSLEIATIGKYVGIFQLTFGCIIFYFLALKIFKNENIAIILTIVFSVTTLGSILLLTQYWPTAMAIFFGLIFNLNYYNRIKGFEENCYIKYPNNLKYYLIQSILAISIIITHVTSAVVYITPFIFISFFLAFQNRKFVNELVFYIIIFLVNLFVNPFGLLVFFSFGSLTQYGILILVAIPVAIFGIYIYNYFLKNYSFSMKNPKLGNFDKSNSIFWIEKRFFRKVILPVIAIAGPLIYYFINIGTKKYYPADVRIMTLDIATVAIIIASAIVGFNCYRDYNLTGKLNFIYFTFAIVFIGALFLIGIVYTYILRIITLLIPFLFLGFGYYLLYSSKTWFSKPRSKKLVLCLFMLNIITSVGYQITLQEDVSVSESVFIQNSLYFTQQSRNNFDEMSDLDNKPSINSTNSSILLIGIFHWRYPVYYYGDEGQISYEQYKTKHIPPENHTYIDENGTEVNALQELYSTPEFDDVDNVMIIMEEKYKTRGLLLWDAMDYGVLTEEEFESYNEFDYLNRIAVGNHQKSLYWVIPPV